ncbi:MAG: FAD-dependent oxidoreductase, partial [Lachnospiraceae bacterium]|nr:FAD-dependent oxidoreductase [Lachnospiraceae bacterium]
AVAIRAYAQAEKAKSVVIIGGGMVGLETAENLKKSGLEVTVVEMQNQILPGLLDSDMAEQTAAALRKSGIRVLTGAGVKEILGDSKAEGVIAASMKIPAQVVVMAVGVRPATDFLEGSGISMEQGAILVNEYMETSLEDVYAAGDCVKVTNRLTGKYQFSQMGSTANITGRILARRAAGKEASYAGCLGTGIMQLMDGFNVGRTGLTQARAEAEGYIVEATVCVNDEKPGYMPGSTYCVVKMVVEKETGRVLGVQVVGNEAVNKVTDAAALAISNGMTSYELEDVDFAYAPPFATAIHPLAQTAFVMNNKLEGIMDSMTPAEYAAGAAKGYTVVDLLPAKTIPGAVWVDVTAIDGPVKGLEKDQKLLLVCNRGRKAYLAQNRLKAAGYTNTKVLEGGVLLNNVRVKIVGTIPAEEIKRVKGLGCLIDKRYGDRFNMRVITRNGKITAEEQKAVAECAEKYGSGEVTMTTRLTLEIQGIPYEHIDEAIRFLNEHDLETGGTGSLVRPVVSCKGTTCQYGLADTFGLSEKLHETFYKGWHTVTLPHKFKIAVGGCPNNCVKPSLNDLGIIGQRVPAPDLSKCRGCKVCQVENACPIKIAKLQDGKVVIDPSACNHCGRCVGKCPFGALDESMYGFKVYVGGRWGKRVREATPLRKIFTSEDEVMEIVEKALLLFRDEGITGERFSDTIERLGFDYVEDKLLNGTIDKEEVLKKTVIGGAKC